MTDEEESGGDGEGRGGGVVLEAKGVNTTSSGQSSISPLTAKQNNQLLCYFSRV